MSNINVIKDYTTKITDSPGAIYGEFTKQMLRDHEQSDFNQYLKKI